MTQFVNDIENYTNTCIPTEQHNFSPVKLLDSFDPLQFKPIYIINTQRDPMPWHQIFDLQCAFQRVGIDPAKYKVWTIPRSSEHSFEYWHSPIKDTVPIDFNIKVSDRVIEFLDDQLNYHP